MNIRILSSAFVAAALVCGSAGMASAQYAPQAFPSGGVGNSNTGPGAQFGGHTGVLGQTGPSPFAYDEDEDLSTGSIVEAQPGYGPRAYRDPSAPFPSGSVGNSNTGPGARPNY